MTIRCFLFCWVIGFIPIQCTQPSSAVPAKPNIILILADDLGIPQVGCYGSTFYRTPHIDKLAQEGAIFTQAYAAAAICSPTRAALYTGKYPARLHLTDFIGAKNPTQLPITEVSDWQKYLPLDEITIAEALKGQGYKTALFGKWHLSKAKTPPESLSHNPDHQGFDESFVTYKPAPHLPIGPWQEAEKDGHSVDTITNRSIQFIQQYSQEAPFLLIISHNTIHDPLMEREERIRSYSTITSSQKAENHPTIAAMVERLDQSVGKILQTVTEAGILGQTLIIFYSDNGAKHAYAAQTPFRAGKGWLYEGGIRVPLIMHHKGKISPGTRISDMVSSIDFFPTLWAYTQQTEPPYELLDGINLVPALLEQQPLKERALYWHYPHYHKGSGMKPAAAIRSGKYKLIEWYKEKLLDIEGAYELYDLTSDSGEQHNLFTKLPDKAEELKGLLANWKEEVEAQEPTIHSSLAID